MASATPARRDSADLERLLSIAEAAEVLNVPCSWLRHKVTERQVPFTKIGRHVRFSRDHLQQIVASGEQGSTAPSMRPMVVGRRRKVID